MHKHLPNTRRAANTLSLGVIFESVMPLKLFKDFVLVHNLFYACLLHVEYMRFRMNNFSYNVLLKAIHIFMETTNKNRNLFFFYLE